MYTPNYERRGILPALSGEVVLRNNDVSTFSLDVDGGDLLASRFERGWRVVIEDEGEMLLCGEANKIGTEPKAGVRDLTVSGKDDMVWLQNMISLPEPDKLPDNQGVAAYYKAKANSGQLITDLVRTHIGQSAPTGYKRPLWVEPSTLGGVASINSRFKPLLDEVATLAQGVLNVRMTQDDEAQRTVMTVAEGRDKSRAIRLTEDNNGLDDWNMDQDAPDVTQVLVAGQGEGEARTLKLVKGNDNDWNFWALRFQDRRDTDELDQLIQAGEETLDEGREKSTISLGVQETDNKRFGRDFWLGDTITVQLADRAVVSDVVQSARIKWGPEGRTVELTVGPVLDEQDAPRWVPLVRKLMREVRALQTR